jgi:hypothetical protein
MEKSNCNFDTSTFLSLDNLLRNSAHNTPRISPDKEDEEHEEEIKVECFEIEQGPLNLNT